MATGWPNGCGGKATNSWPASATNTHFSLARLQVVEAAVQALIGEDFAGDRQARRWLDEDEGHIRRGMHRDVRAALVGDRG